MSATIEIRYSNDGGHNWSGWRELAAGDTGDFITPLIARRLGMARHRIWEIRDTSDTPQDIIAASLMVESG